MLFSDKLRIIFVALLAFLAGVVQAEKLPAFNVAESEITVSGLSSGAFFAVQLNVAFSSIMSGAAIFAGGPYDCAEGSMTEATTCMNPILKKPDAKKYIATTLSRSKSGDIDDSSNLSKQKVFLFSGTQDTTVKQAVMDSLRDYYANFKTDVKYVNDMQAAHTQPTDDPANKNGCLTSASPYLSNCNYDGAGEAFKHIYGTLNPRNEGTLTGTLQPFDQSEFGGAAMASTGYVFVPKACANGESCRLHISFHGCVQNYDKVGDAYTAHSGYNRWGDANNIIVLYPQTGASATNACWNWFGYGGDSHYDEKSGSQMAAVKKMIDRISSGMQPPLAAPADFHVTGVSDSSISLAWDGVAGADGYHVYRGADLVSGVVTATSLTDSGLASGTAYQYQVAAVAGKSDGSKSGVITAKTSGNPPPISPPVGLSATKTTKDSVSLSWTAVTLATSYNVYRDGVKIGTSSTPSFDDAGLAPETLYSYTVAAVDSQGHESVPSSPLSVKTSSAFTCQQFTTSNNAHVVAGRAHDKAGTAYANGSEDKMGLDNIFYQSTLAETEEGYFVVGSCPTEKTVFLPDSFLE